MASVIIVGAGLFGSMAAKACRIAGHDVMMFDDHRLMSGSKPAACLIKPEWLMNLGELAKPGLEALEKLYKVCEITFSTWNMTLVKLQWVDPSHILDMGQQVSNRKVTSVGNGEVVAGGVKVLGHVLVATGSWANELIPGIESVRSLAGVALIYNGNSGRSHITPYAPFKQAISFARDEGMTWFGDGTAILKKNWGPEYVERSIERANQLHGLERHRLNREIQGYRPLVTDHRGLFSQVADRTWVVTGGGKNGTVLAAYYAMKFVEAIA